MPAKSDWGAELRQRLASLRLAPAREAEVVEELSQHLDDRYQELRAAGRSAADARRAVLDDLNEDGGLARWMQALSQAHTPPPIAPGQPPARLFGGFWKDVRYAVRAAARQPGFTATVVLTLAVSIGVNTTIFTLVNAAVLRDLPFADAERLVTLGVT